MGAVSAGTALAWTSPVLPQISAPDPSSNTTTAGNSTDSNTPELQLTLSQRKSDEMIVKNYNELLFNFTVIEFSSVTQILK